MAQALQALFAALGTVAITIRLAFCVWIVVVDGADHLALFINTRRTERAVGLDQIFSWRNALLVGYARLANSHFAIFFPNPQAFLFWLTPHVSGRTYAAVCVPIASNKRRVRWLLLRHDSFHLGAGGEEEERNEEDAKVAEGHRCKR